MDKLGLDVSVVLTLYKRPEYLEAQLEAIENQSLKPKEILLYQDGTGDTVQIPENIKERFNLIEISPENKGVWERFNFARKNVKSKYVCILDDDTIPGSRWLENCMTEMLEQEGLYGAIGIVSEDNVYDSCHHKRVGWANNNDETLRVDFAGHSWFLKTEWLDYMFEGTEELQKYKICAEDMTLSFKLQQHGINTYIPQQPQGNKDLWGSIKGDEFGSDAQSLFINNGWTKMTAAFDILVNKYGFKTIQEQDPKYYDYLIKYKSRKNKKKKTFLKQIFSIENEYSKNKKRKVITIAGIKISMMVNQKTGNKPLYKIIYRYTIKLFLDTISLRPLRKLIKKRKEEKRNRQMVSGIEENLSDNSVLIFQIQFYNQEGTVCYNGGAERYVQDLADVIANLGYSPILIQTSYDEVWIKNVGKLKVIGIPKRRYFESINYFSKFQFVIYSGLYLWGKKLLHPNVLISHGVNWDITNKDTNISMVFNIFKDADNIVSVDTNTISWLRSTFSKSFLDKNYVFIPNYVDTSLYKPIEKKNKNIKMIFPRRASDERGYWLMSSVLPEILDKYKNIDFDFVGFAHGEKIKKDINRLMLMYPKRVNSYMVNPDEMVAIYQKADISLIPTIYAEGTSLSCLEAQACGNAVISTNIGGLPNLIIDGFNGVLINPNAKELKNAIDKVMSDENFRKYISKNAVTVAKHFDKTIWKQKWTDFINTNFFNFAVKKNSVLIVEPNPYHGEILPGFVNYFQNIGYNVDLLVRNENNVKDIFSKFNQKSNCYCGNAQCMKNFLKHSKVEQYEYLFISSSAFWETNAYIGSYLDYLGFIPKTKNGILMVEHNIIPYLKQYGEEKYLKEKRLFSLSGFNNTPMLNPHYFGENIRITNKTENIVNFIAVGGIVKECKNHELLIDAVLKLAKISNKFKVTIIGSGSLDIPDEINNYMDFKGRLSYENMYEELEKADFILPLLDYSQEAHRRYLSATTTGARQLSLGFLKPVLINDYFAKSYGYNSNNSIVYKENDLFEAMKKAIELSNEDYITMQKNLKILADDIYSKSLENLKKAVNKNA